MPRVPHPAVRRALVATATAAIMITVVGGCVQATDTQEPATRTTVAEDGGDASRELVRIDRLNPSAAPSVGIAPSAQPSPAPVTTAPERRTPPRLLVVAPTAVPERTLEAISRMKRVRHVVAVDAGAVTFSGHTVNLLAVDPAEFRSWVPRAVAEQPAVWEALARGELVAETAAARRLGLQLGAFYQVDGGPRLRVAAFAPLGLPGVDGLVSTGTGRTLGLPPDVAVLVHGPRGVTALGPRVSKVLGEGTQVVAIGEDGTVQPQAERTPARKNDRERLSGAEQVYVGRPETYLELYRLSARACPGLSWTVLAAIGQVESSHGRNNGPSSAGAMGPMQFMPATWKAYGVDGDGDGVADIWNPYDAVPSAARYLCANGAGKGGKHLERAIWHYNHSWSYVAKVLSVARGYEQAYPDR